ncbi:phosphotransferase [Nonomuraea rhodomycinica]|uniref:Phosphotransferase n=1 Tax=Nonomuraea rhodomycinica TaxID=1712872 RepID=A0A7Y6MDA5_9ACTN|nr:phosphotransferase [Nonomuraea rhodomycinica]NUW43667.1 phosphotransferase [Nonomuraea rhodomycinica]
MTPARGRSFLGRGEIAELAEPVFGRGRRVAEAQRLRGGSKKGVYRVLFEDGSSAVLYVWSAEEDYWPATSGDSAASSGEGPFSHASGLRFFETSVACLERAGVRVPRLRFADGTRSRRPYDFAFAEDVRGGTLEERLTDDPLGARAVLARLGEALELMRRRTSPRIGKVADVLDGPETAEGGSRAGRPPRIRQAQAVVLDRALRHLDEAAARVGSIAEVREQCRAVLEELAEGIEPRTRHGLIHGELGPDHVLVDDRDEPVLIDIEGTMFFDVEWEHVFLRIRFGEHYEDLRVDGLDERRMELYRLAQHLSLVAGPLRLLDGDFPDRRFMEGLVAHHTGVTLELLRSR